MKLVAMILTRRLSSDKGFVRSTVVVFAIIPQAVPLSGGTLYIYVCMCMCWG